VKKLNQKGALDTVLILGIIVALFVGGGVLFALTSESDAPNVDDVQINNVDDDTKIIESNSLLSVEGVVQEVFEDCARYRVLEGGAVVERNNITCDGGSFIVVDDVRIQTSSGFVPVEESYVTEISDITPGDTLKVSYIAGEFTNSINCEECGITEL
jgi:hypothetical protein